MWAQLPGLLTRSIPAMVSPRKTSSERSRSFFGSATGEVATPRGGVSASGGWTVVAMLAASSIRTALGGGEDAANIPLVPALDQPQSGICRAAAEGSIGAARAVLRIDTR